MTTKRLAAASTGATDTKSPSTDHRIWLNKKFFVTQDYFDFIQGLVEILIRYVDRGKKYFLKDMFGRRFWDDEFSPHERQIIGMCVARMVRNGILPLDFVKKKSRYPLQYRLK